MPQQIKSRRGRNWIFTGCLGIGVICLCVGVAAVTMSGGQPTPAAPPVVLATDELVPAVFTEPAPTVTQRSDTATPRPTRTPRATSTTRPPTVTPAPTRTLAPVFTATAAAPPTQAPLPTQPLPAPTQPPPPQPVNYDSNGDGRVTCADFSTQAAAQAAYNAGYTNLDGNDNDGLACESLP